MEVTTREIMWNIPYTFKMAMYVLLVISTAAFIKGFYDKIQFITAGKGIGHLKELLPKSLNWSKFFKTLLLTGKVPRKKKSLFFII